MGQASTPTTSTHRTLDGLHHIPRDRLVASSSRHSTRTNHESHPSVHESSLRSHRPERPDRFAGRRLTATALARPGFLAHSSGCVNSPPRCPPDNPPPDINKSGILDIARTVFGAAWASARAKNKKPALAEAMEQAFAVGVSADMHAAALAWMPPGFAAFDTGRVVEEAGGDADPPAAPDASVPDTGFAAGAKPEAPAETPADSPKRASVVASIEAPSATERRAAALAASTIGNGNAAEAGEPVAAASVGAAATVDAMPPVPMNGHDTAPDPLEIPDFLRGGH